MFHGLRAGAKGKPKRSGLGIVCGAVSGNLEVLEFDSNGSAYEDFKAAAHALGSLCDARSVDDLAGYAVNGASSPNPDEVALGLAATDALGQIHPADLVKRLKSVHAKGARPDAQRAADAAVAGRGTCR